MAEEAGKSRKLVLSDGKSSKFWNIELKGKFLHDYLSASRNFGAVSRERVLTLRKLHRSISETETAVVTSADAVCGNTTAE